MKSSLEVIKQNSRKRIRNYFIKLRIKEVITYKESLSLGRALQPL